jgi:type I restriction enzyme M protein
MLTSETKRRIDNCRDVLVGKLPQPSNQVELITLALIYKFMDDLDEESVKLGGKRSFFTGELAKYRWRNLLPQTVSADERVTLFSEGVEALGHPKKAAHLPGLFRDIFRNAFLKFRDGRILTMFLTEVNGFAYSHSEELGNAFEYLLQCTGAQGENGQFRTPRHIIDFIVACLDPQPGDKILDPACGTGGFLVSAYRHILANHTSADKSRSSGRESAHIESSQRSEPTHVGCYSSTVIPGDLLTFAQRQQVYKNLAGYDVDDQMVKLSKVNLFLHGFPDPAIHIYDTLSNDARWHEKADLILANPPFMTPKGGVTPHTRFRIAAKKAEVLFTDYIAEHLSGDGRGGVIVPNGIVATTQNAYVKLRRYLVEDLLVAVVSLPAGVFKPYSGVKTSILLLDKKLARTAKEILFLKITADGFDLGDKRNPIAANDLPEAERVVKLWFAGKLNETTESTVAWKTVEKKSLLEHHSCSLQSEAFLDEAPERSIEHEMVSLGDVCRLYQPKTITAQDLVADGAYIVFGANGVIGRYTEFNHEHPEVVVTCRGATCGTVNMTSEKCWITGNAMVVSPLDERIEKKFLFYLLQASDLSSTISGSAQPQITRQSLSPYEIPLPPLEEQRRIVAEIEGYQKVLDGARQILAGYRAQIPDQQEWPVVELRELIEGKPKNGYSGKPVQHATKLKVLTLTATTSGKMDITKFKYLDEHIPKDSPCRCRRGDIYLQRGNTKELVGTAALLDVDVDDLIYPDLMIRVRADETKILTTFLLHTLQSQPVREYLMRNAGGAAGNMPKINQGIVESIPIPLPPLSEQRRLVAELDAEAAQMDSVRALIPRFEAKIQRVLDRVWGNGVEVEK